MSEHTRDGDIIVRFADRFALQQSWWLASEIARRHGNLQISRVGDDTYQGILLVHDGSMGRRIQFDLPGGAAWQNKAGEVERMSWIDVFEADDPHAAVKRLERESGLGIPESAAETNLRTIVYRVAAALLAAKLDDRHSWQIVPAPLVTSGVEADESLAMLRRFASTGPQIDYAYADMAELYDHATALGTTPRWHETFWTVLRDVEPVMILDEAGYAHLDGGVQINLLALYRGLGREVAAVAGVILMDPDAALAIAQRYEGPIE